MKTLSYIYFSTRTFFLQEQRSFARMEYGGPYLLPSAIQASARDNKKLVEKERKLLEKSVREKEAALRDDDNVFDVSYENQGDSTADVVSATDIKVSCLLTSSKNDLGYHVPFPDTESRHSSQLYFLRTLIVSVWEGEEQG